jgi:hypothetical protein
MHVAVHRVAYLQVFEHHVQHLITAVLPFTMFTYSWELEHMKQRDRFV